MFRQRVLKIPIWNPNYAYWRHMFFAAIRQAHCVSTYVMCSTPFMEQIWDLMLLHKSFFRFNCIHIFQFVCTSASTFALGRGKWLRKNEQSPIRWGLDRRSQAENTQTKCICHLPGLQLGPGPIESNEKNAFAKKKIFNYVAKEKNRLLPTYASKSAAKKNQTGSSKAAPQNGNGNRKLQLCAQSSKVAQQQWPQK